ncbi:hypothetical protein [Polaromonas sp. YR568]|uniref:hypothetical protein n=1 Tax=Polaromonas sp. YR568 TaxID=1855301 RepID=UPI003137B535
MKTPLDLLKGAIVRGSELNDDSLNLSFDSVRLVVHNKWDMRRAAGGKVHHSDLVGAAITNLLTSDAEIRFEFGPIALYVDLSASAWSGPEAAVLYVNGVPVVAWT